MTRAARGTGTVELHRGRWRVRLRFADGTRRPVTCPDDVNTRELAEAFRDALLLELRGTEHDPALRAAATLGAWAARWLDAREETHRDARGDRHRWSRFWRDDPIAAVSLRALSPAALLDAGSRLVALDLARQTTRNAWTTLRACVTAAVHARELSADRAAELLTAKLPPLRVSRSTSQEEKWHYLSPDEIERVRSVDMRPDQRAAFEVGIFAGLRAGELHALRWSDVHLGGPAPHVVVARSRGTATKSGKVGRVRLLAPAVRALLRYASEVGADTRSNALLWPSTHGGMHAHGYDWGWADSAKGGAGLRTRAHVRPEVTWHDATRHTCASHLHMGTWVAQGWLERALRLEEVSKWLRHSSIAVTQRYAHLSLDSMPIPRAPDFGPLGPPLLSNPSRPRELNSGPTVYETVSAGPRLLVIPGDGAQTGPVELAEMTLRAIAERDEAALPGLAMRLSRAVLDAAKSETALPRKAVKR